MEHTHTHVATATAPTTKSRAENAAAIRHCLAYLTREALDAGLAELAQLLEVCRLAAVDASREVVH
jgi:hypothetical protein